MKITIDEIYCISEDKIIYKATVTGTHTGYFGEIPPTEKSFKIEILEIDRIVDGKIVEEWVYVNWLHIFQQLGFTLTPPEITQ